MKRNSPISLIATPDKGYALDKVLVNGKAVMGTEFKISRISTVTATFNIVSAIDAAAINDARVTTASGSISFLCQREFSPRYSLLMEREYVAWLPEHQLSQSPTAYISCAQRMVLT